MNGNNIIILKGATAIAGTKSQEIQTGCEVIEISSPTTGTWRQYLAGRKEWGISVSYLVLAASGMADLLQIGESYTIVIKDRDNTTSLSGTAILKSAKQTYTRGNLVAGAYQFVGSGELTQATPTT